MAAHFTSSRGSGRSSWCLPLRHLAHPFGHRGGASLAGPFSPSSRSVRNACFRDRLPSTARRDPASFTAPALMRTFWGSASRSSCPSPPWMSTVLPWQAATPPPYTCPPSNAASLPRGIVTWPTPYHSSASVYYLLRLYCSLPAGWLYLQHTFTATCVFPPFIVSGFAMYVTVGPRSAQCSPSGGKKKDA